MGGDVINGGPLGGNSAELIVLALNLLGGREEGEFVSAALNSVRAAAATQHDGILHVL